MGDEVRVTVIAAGFDRWDDERRDAAGRAAAATPTPGGPAPAARPCADRRLRRRRRRRRRRSTTTTTSTSRPSSSSGAPHARAPPRPRPASRVDAAPGVRDRGPTASSLPRPPAEPIGDLAVDGARCRASRLPARRWTCRGPGCARSTAPTVTWSPAPDDRGRTRRRARPTRVVTAVREVSPSPCRPPTARRRRCCERRGRGRRRPRRLAGPGTPAWSRPRSTRMRDARAPDHRRRRSARASDPSATSSAPTTSTASVAALRAGGAGPDRARARRRSTCVAARRRARSPSAGVDLADDRRRRAPPCGPDGRCVLAPGPPGRPGAWPPSSGGRRSRPRAVTPRADRRRWRERLDRRPRPHRGRRRRARPVALVAVTKGFGPEVVRRRARRRARATWARTTPRSCVAKDASCGRGRCTAPRRGGTSSAGSSATRCACSPRRRRCGRASTGSSSCAEIAKRAPGATVLVQVNLSGEAQKGGCRARRRAGAGGRGARRRARRPRPDGRRPAGRTAEAARPGFGALVALGRRPRPARSARWA